MDHKRYEIKWMGRCQYGTDDKIWGWFTYNDTQTTDTQSLVNTQTKYYFWAHTGKTVQFKRHEGWYTSPDHAVKAKKSNKYVEIKADDLLEFWPQFYADLDRYFIFFMLQSGT